MSHSFHFWKISTTNDNIFKNLIAYQNWHAMQQKRSVCILFVQILDIATVKEFGSYDKNHKIFSEDDLNGNMLKIITKSYIQNLVRQSVLKNKNDFLTTNNFGKQFVMV